MFPTIKLIKQGGHQIEESLMVFAAYVSKAKPEPVGASLRNQNLRTTVTNSLLDLSESGKHLSYSQ